jgi:hypothetical protein
MVMSSFDASASAIRILGWTALERAQPRAFCRDAPALLREAGRGRNRCRAGERVLGDLHRGAGRVGLLHVDRAIQGEFADDDLGAPGGSTYDLPRYREGSPREVQNAID